MLKRRGALLSTAALSLALGLGFGPVSAEPLSDAIALAYQTNPTLQAQRAQQRALDETFVQARTALRPTVDATASVTYQRDDAPDFAGVDLNDDGDFDDMFEQPPNSNITEAEVGSVGLSLSQTLYSGGRISHGIRAARSAVLRGRENLRDIEQQVLSNVIQAYMDVRRDIEILRIRSENIGVLQRQLEEASARFEVGEITRTDVAQAEARLAQARSDLSNAQAQLTLSRAAYAATVGQTPTDLEPPPPLPNLPSEFEQALDTALEFNPNLGAAVFNQDVAEANVARARAAYRPSVSLSSTYGSSDDLDGFDLTQQNSLNARVGVSVPLFTGGLNRSQVAEALEQANAAQAQVEGARRDVLRSVSSAYAQVTSSTAQLEASREQVRAARIAAEGVRQEAQVGLRTTLDVLNQELELRNAEVNLASAERNQYVAQALLLAAMGRLSGRDLAVDAPIYDPSANFDRVRNRGGLPWDPVVEAIDRIGAPPVRETPDQPDAPVDAALKPSEIVRTAPQ
ncbi:TolC family outer membrane protein [Brevundimonas sp. 2R-24]|uniref:TolC family outer membrane protein n=1 Tax=Peiella sedimenti TaxID=3061083 RepID=A0ABT8SMD0_9CAUL|nr:TolC family outer membrane protein [Caulobacteraceae bacterium XZ-24]